MTSTALRLADLTKEERTALLKDYTPEQKHALIYDWDFWARSEQKLPEEPWTTLVKLAGRGEGKSRLGAETVRKWSDDVARIALVAETAADNRDVLVEGESGILATSPPWNMPDYEPSKRRLTWPNGCIATLYSGDSPGQLRGPQHEKAWMDEWCKYRYPVECLDNLMLGLRLGKNPQLIITTTPRPMKALKDLLALPGTKLSRGTTFDNLDNLAPAFRETVLARYEGTRLGRQELYAEILDDAEGALWNGDLIAANRFTGEVPDFSRIVVGVDPSGGVNEIGIIVCGLVGHGAEAKAYVLDDRTLLGSPQEWGTAVVTGYHAWKADAILGEKNFGGEMVEHVVRSIDHNVRYRNVISSRSKEIRAEPVVGLYEQNRVLHVGYFSELEQEQTSWVPPGRPEASKWSPNRIDALVFAVTDLIVLHPASAEATVRVAQGRISDYVG